MAWSARMARDGADVGARHCLARLERVPASGRHRSSTVVDAKAFSAALKLDMAAARIAAITNPATPGGRFCHMYRG